MKILVTGGAGFIELHLVNRLVKKGNWEIVGLDNFNDYYDVNLKCARLKESGISKDKIKYNRFSFSEKNGKYRFIKLNLKDKDNILKLFARENFYYVVNLAAQAGVRYSWTNPYTYTQSNILGFFNIVEACRQNKIKHLFYASSLSLYSLIKKMPLTTTDKFDHPISLYSATKKSNEYIAHIYSYLYNIPTTGLRFFTVYSPWGRPDMVLFKFTEAVLNDKYIEVYKWEYD